jgi:hypothetical protein
MKFDSSLTSNWYVCIKHTHDARMKSLLKIFLESVNVETRRVREREKLKVPLRRRKSWTELIWAYLMVRHLSFETAPPSCLRKPARKKIMKKSKADERDLQHKNPINHLVRYGVKSDQRRSESMYDSRKWNEIFCEYNSRVQYFLPLLTCVCSSICSFAPYHAREIFLVLAPWKGCELLLFILLYFALNIFLTGFWSEWIIFIYFSRFSFLHSTTTLRFSLSFLRSLRAEQKDRFIKHVLLAPCDLWEK